MIHRLKGERLRLFLANSETFVEGELLDVEGGFCEVRERDGESVYVNLANIDVIRVMPEVNA